MLSPSTRTTLFPYTTLFRSFNVTNTTSFDVPGDNVTQNENFNGFPAQGQPLYNGWPCAGKPLKFSFWVTDRKSTRLNSSHSSISYAVLCLKKQTLTNSNVRHLFLLYFNTFYFHAIAIYENYPLSLHDALPIFQCDQYHQFRRPRR